MSKLNYKMLYEQIKISKIELLEELRKKDIIVFNNYNTGKICILDEKLEKCEDKLDKAQKELKILEKRFNEQRNFINKVIEALEEEDIFIDYNPYTCTVNIF